MKSMKLEKFTMFLVPFVYAYNAVPPIHINLNQGLPDDVIPWCLNDTLES